MSDEIELRLAWSAVAARGAAAPHDGRSVQGRSGEVQTGTGRAGEVLDDVVGRHRQAHRRYHGLRHVVWVIRHVHELTDALAASEPAPDAVDVARAVAAAFFHDAVYDPTAADNEERSAVLATRQLAAIGWADHDTAAVAGDIRATAGHLLAGAGDGASDVTRDVLLDADLAVLGSDAAAYQAYATGVRTEYAHVPDDVWRARRADVVRHLLGRHRLYATDVARAWWDHQARANLTAELADLSAAQR